MSGRKRNGHPLFVQSDAYILYGATVTFQVCATALYGTELRRAMPDCDVRFHSITFVVSRGGIAGGKPATQFADLGLCANGASAPLLFGRVSRFPDIVTSA